MPFQRTVLAALTLSFCGWAFAQDETEARRLLDAGRTEEAIGAYTRLLSSSPRHPDWLLLRGIAHSRNQQWREAIDDLEAAAAVSPGYADVWSALGNVYRWNDRPAAAADAYARLASLRPNDPEPQSLRARALLTAGDLAGARQAAARARALGASEEVLAPIESALTARMQANAPAASGHRWALSAGAGHTSSGIGNANERSLTLRHYTPAGSIAIEKLDIRRFGSQDSAYALDAYPRLWEGAYANVRYQHAGSPVLYPGTAWRAELYQGLGNGWEAAASHDELGFDSHVKIKGVALARYWGNFYLRWRHQQVSSDTSSGNGDRLTVRYYYEGDADHYVEANLSSGRSDDYGGTLTATASRSDSRGLAWYHFVTRDWGLKASWSQATDSSSAASRERSLNLGLIYRW